MGSHVGTVASCCRIYAWACVTSSDITPYTGVLKISLAGANNLVPTTGLTPCIIILPVYTCNYSGARKNIDAR